MTTKLVRTLLVALIGALLSTPLYAQKDSPSVAIKIVLAGTVQGDVVLIPPHEKPGKQAVAYPKDAAGEGVGGTVKLKLLVDTDGSIKESQVLENGGDKRLLRAAVEGLRTTGLTAGTIDKKPTEMWVAVEVTFNPGRKNKSLAPGKDRDEEYEEIAFASSDEVDMPVIGPAYAFSENEVEYDIDDFVPEAAPPSYDRQELMELIKYPELARENGIEGTVMLGVKIDKDGTPLQVIVRHSTNKIFEAPAKEAAGKLTYTPAVQNGHPIQMWLTFRIEFELTEPETPNEEVEYGIDDYVPDATPPFYDRSELTRLIHYPRKARESNMEGVVTVGVQVGTDGTPLQTLVRNSTDEIFEDNAIEAVKKLTFTPATQNGEPIKMWLTFMIEFELE